MGKYIRRTRRGSLGSNFHDMCIGLVADGAWHIAEPVTMQDNLVCVTEEGIFSTAVLVENQRQLDQLLKMKKKKKWFVYNDAGYYAR